MYPHDYNIIICEIKSKRDSNPTQIRESRLTREYKVKRTDLGVTSSSSTQHTEIYNKTILFCTLFSNLNCKSLIHSRCLLLFKSVNLLSFNSSHFFLYRKTILLSSLPFSKKTFFSVVKTRKHFWAKITSEFVSECFQTNDVKPQFFSVSIW